MTTGKNAMSISQRIAAAKRGLDAASGKSKSRAAKESAGGGPKPAREARPKTVEQHGSAK